MYRVCFISLGCAKNLVDSEQMLASLQDAGYMITDSLETADYAVINTCAFIDSAKMEAIDAILMAGQYKTIGKLRRIIVTGCLAERYKEELLQEMPEIDVLVGTGSVRDIVKALEAKPSSCFFGDVNAPIESSERIVSTGTGWAYIKIAEGCSNNCAYCVIPAIRGKYRSRSMESIVSEAKALAMSGVKELIIVAQDPTMYGVDLYHKRTLSDLLKRLAEIKELSWIRLHYLYPDAVDEELIDTIANEDKILKYLDIPIQHINNNILKTMGRRGTGDEIRVLFKKLRERIPGVVLRTSVITGLPGEGDAEFEELVAFLKEARIERAGVFRFSPQEGTRAYEMDRPDEDTANERAEIIERLQADIMDDYNNSRIGTTVRVICEDYSPDTGLYAARSFAESPEVDGYIWITSRDNTQVLNPGEFYDVIIRGTMNDEPVGECVSGGEI